MKNNLSIALIATALLLPAVACAADEVAAPTEAKAQLAIIVSESVGFRSRPIDDYIRLDIAFTKTAKERKWPVEIVMERFAAGLPDYDREVTIFTQPIRQEIPGEFTMRGWVTLKTNGKKHDFGIVKVDFRPRLGEQMDDALQKLADRYAGAVGDKIEPILFPKEEPAKP